jgi:hypothetical protein
MKAHIYEISRLYKQDAARWEDMLAKLEEERDFRFFGYKALREAVVLEMRSPGAGRPHLVRSFASPAVNKQEEAMRRNSYAALDTFIDSIRPKLGDLQQNFMTVRQPACRWEGHDLSGGFHFSALNKKGETVYLYISASSHDDEKDKDVQQRKATIELLNIIAEHRFSAEPSRVWFVDLNTDTIHKPRKSVLRLRQDLKRTLDHLQRMRREAA